MHFSTKDQINRGDTDESGTESSLFPPISIFNPEIVIITQVGEQTTTGQTYNPFMLSERVDIPFSDGNHPPVYFGPEMEPYDKYYRRISDSYNGNEFKDKTFFNVFTHDVYNLFHIPESSFQSPFPQLEGFSSYDDYLSTLKEWYIRAVKYFASTFLPSPISGLIRFPAPPKVFSKEEKSNPARFKTFKANQWPLLSNNYFQMLDIIFNQTEFNPDDPFENQIPKREVIQMKHHVSSQDQWVSHLIPVEPSPVLYKNYEEFEESFLRWSQVAQGTMPLPPCPQDMSQLLNIDQVDIPFEQKIIKKSMSEAVFNTIINNGVDSRLLNASAHDFGKLSGILYELRSEQSDPEIDDFSDKNILFVFNIDAYAFQKDYMTYGYDSKSLEVHHPYYSYKHFWLTENYDEEVSASVTMTRTIDWELINGLLKFVLQPNQIQDYMRITFSGKSLATHLSAFFSEKSNLIQLMDHVERSWDTKIHISFFLHQIFINEKSSTICHIFEDLENLEMFHRFINLLILTSSKITHLLPVIKSNVSELRIINQFYLFSCLIKLFTELTLTDFFESIYSKCRELSIICSRFLSNGEFRQLITNGLLSNEMNDETRAALMIVYSDSQHLHRILVGNGYLDWLNSVSTTQNGIALINSLAHSDALYSLAFLFLKQSIEDLKKMIPEITPIMCYFIRSVCVYLLESVEQMHLKLSGKALLPFFEVFSLSEKECVSMILVPIASLLCNKVLVYDFRSADLKLFIIRCICKFCEVINFQNGYVFRQQVQALIILARDEHACFSMSQKKDFMNKLVLQLKEKDVTVVKHAWKLFRMMTKFPNVIKEVLSDKTIKTALASNFFAKSTIVLRKMLRFVLFVMNNMEAFSKQIAEICMSSIGSVVVSYSLRKKNFKDDQKTSIALQNFITFIKESKSEDLTELRESVFKHLDSFEKDRRSSLKRNSLLFNRF